MKLDQIPKKNPFNVPEGYFDTLPGIVQSRIETERPVIQSRVYVRLAFRYALPVLVFIVAGIFWFRSQNSHVEFETELAAIDAQDLAFYIEGIDIDADELIESVAWSTEELEQLENSIYASYNLPDTELNVLLDVYEVEPLKDSAQ